MEERRKPTNGEIKLNMIKSGIPKVFWSNDYSVKKRGLSTTLEAVKSMDVSQGVAVFRSTGKDSSISFHSIARALVIEGYAVTKIFTCDISRFMKFDETDDYYLQAAIDSLRGSKSKVDYVFVNAYNFGREDISEFLERFLYSDTMLCIFTSDFDKKKLSESGLYFDEHVARSAIVMDI